MNTVKSGYLMELRRRLAALPEEEREAALTYYGEYFDDAGIDEAERVLNELGPAKLLAEQILSGYSRDYADAGAGNYSTQVPATPEDAAKARREEEQPKQQAKAEKPSPPQRRGASLLLIILLVILALPLLIPLIISVLAVCLGLIASVIGVGVAVGTAVLVILAVGALLLIAGIGLLVVHTASALLACGVGLALLGAGILLALLCGWVCLKVVPALIRFIIQVLSWPFKRRAVSA